MRVYKKDPNNPTKPLTNQPKDYPRTVPSDYKPQADEMVRPHRGIDFTSHDAKGKVASVEFKAGVYGTVVAPVGGSVGTVTVRLANGMTVQYLHTSERNVKIGDPVTPDTVLGKTGSTGAGAVHLHVQARDQKGNPINPEEAFHAGSERPKDKK